MKTIPFLLGLLIVIANGPSVMADGEDTVALDEAVAQTEFQRGSKLFAEEKFAEAAKAFRTAYHARPTWKLFYNIGQAETAATHYGAGLIAFENYLAQGGDQIPEARSNDVLKEIKRLRELVGSLDIVAPDGCRVLINGDVRAITPLTGLIKIAAGISHELVVEKDGEILLQQSLRVSGGDERLIRVELAPEAKQPIDATEDSADAKKPVTATPTPAVAPQPATQPTKNRLKPTGIALLATGIASMAAGGITGAMAFQKSGDLESDCPDNTCAESDAVDDMYTSQSLGTASTILFAAGGVLTATGVILLLVGKKRQQETMTRLPITPVASSAFSGLMLKGSF